MVEFVWGSVGAAVISEEALEVSGSLAMNEQVSSAIMISNSDCLVTVPRRISDNCWHLDFFDSSVLGSWMVSCRLVFISLDFSVRSLLRVSKESTLSFSCPHFAMMCHCGCFSLIKCSMCLILAWMSVTSN